MVARSLCKKCETCKTYTYNRIGTTGRKTEFQYCNGNKAVVEASDWYIGSDDYIYSCKRLWGKKRLLHSAYKSKEDLVVDHHNGLKNDNRLCNLRLVSHRCNCQNRHGKSTSIFPGVYKQDDKFVAKIQHNGKRLYLGIFNTEVEAFHSYVTYCIKHDLTINREIPAYKVYSEWLNKKQEKNCGVV